jgi:nucleoside-diphosphate-sugar epimerase
MRVFVAGASGAIGTRLVPQLIDRGHEVIGTSRSRGNAERVRSLGAEPIALDLLDARAVRKAVLETEPEAIVHQATALANLRDLKHFDRSFAETNRLRTEGTDALLAAAREAGVRRFVAQSFASYGRYAREGGPVKSEDDPLDPTPVPAMRETFAAIRHLDEAVTEAGGVAVRYGVFYGASNDGLVEPVRKRQFPIVGEGGGVWSFIHLDDAAAAPCSRSNTTVPASTTSSTTSPPRCASCCPCSRRCLAPSRHAAFPAGSRGCSRARRW